ncbi:hypothetical protein [Rhizobium ruizarguesonis]|uniref:hypothetical protein n=1 Tax=Rhizobium ruizarguesonis TaxID=2081791 RepID=UPI001031AFDC|nr:hypothetical protein [Rhizobium ruizarguesonis]TAV14716.1 hypothetical protein ELI34_04200 [Rhizobium ruizarguesonis]
MKNQPLPSSTSADSDRVYTPAQWAKAVINALPLCGVVLDPARGQGAFYDRFPSSCQKLWCEIEDGRNFFDFDQHVDWIVTNPPWSTIKEFMGHAMAIADNVVFLVTTNHAFTKSRVRLAEELGFGMRSILHLPTPPSLGHSQGFNFQRSGGSADTRGRRK